jgi:D-alanine-D-alanine ligase
MLGNPPEVFPIIEPKHEALPKEYYPIDSLEVKWLLEEELGEDYFNCPAKVDTKLKNDIKNVCISAWNTLGITDFCRIDLRMNAVGNLFILDVNTPPGLIPPEISLTSYFPMAARVKKVDYETLLLKIIEAGMRRYK